MAKMRGAFNTVVGIGAGLIWVTYEILRPRVSRLKRRIVGLFDKKKFTPTDAKEEEQ